MPFYRQKRTRSELFAPNFVSFKRSRPTVTSLSSGAVSALARMNRIGKRNIRSGGYNRSTMEKKFLDTTIATTAVTDTGVILNSSLNVIPQGDSQSERIGRKATIKNIYLDGNITQPVQTATGNMSNVIRIIVYLDKQCNGAAATVGQILQFQDENAFRNMEYVDRFQILYDKKHLVNTTAMGVLTGPVYSTPSVRKRVKFAKKCNIPIFWNSAATTGVIATITSNNIGIMAISNVSNSSFVDATCRIRYVDN